jgi:hypothetical protein
LLIVLAVGPEQFFALRPHSEWIFHEMALRNLV